MTRPVYFISHPDVVVDAAVPVPQWPLSARGRDRMHAGLAQPWVASITALYCSTERKAIDGATILGARLGLAHRAHEDLGENDRSSTGFLPPAEFEALADAFFANPAESVRGWERALDAQRRIVAAVERVVGADCSTGAIALVSHGAVGTLLYCHLAGRPISRRWDQPANGGGNYFCFSLEPRRVEAWWQPFDVVAAPGVA